MATSSILGAERAPTLPGGADVASLGPSDSTDSGSDSVGAFGHDELASDTDAAGTGERAAIEPMLDADSRDILPDHIERALDGEADGEFDSDPDGTESEFEPGSLANEEGPDNVADVADLAEIASLAGEDEEAADSRNASDDPDAVDQDKTG